MMGMLTSGAFYRYYATKITSRRECWKLDFQYASIWVLPRCFLGLFLSQALQISLSKTLYLAPSAIFMQLVLERSSPYLQWKI